MKTQILEQERETLLAYEVVFAQIKTTQQHPLCIIVSDLQSAKSLLAAHQLFSGPNSSSLILFPDWETLPYDDFSPRPESTSRRFELLYRLLQGEPLSIVVTLSNALRLLQPMDYLKQNAFILNQGQTLDPMICSTQLIEQGYRSVREVHEPGTFVKRAGLIDLFPMSSPNPYRIDFFDDTVDSIYTMHPESQRSLKKVDSITLLPAHECPVDEEGQTNFRQNGRDIFGLGFRDDLRYKQISRGEVVGGIESLLPLFFKKTATLLDYFPESTQIIIPSTPQKKIKTYFEQLHNRFIVAQKKHQLLPPEACYATPSPFLKRCALFANSKKNTATALSQRPFVTIKQQSYSIPKGLKKTEERHLAHVLDWLNRTPRLKRILVCLSSMGHATLLREWLEQHNTIKDKKCDHFDIVPDFDAFISSQLTLGLVVNSLSNSIFLPDQGIAILSESDWTTQHIPDLQETEQSKLDVINEQLHQLKTLSVGEPIVHQKHGVGRFLGLVTLEEEQHATECVKIRYQDDAILYIPIQKMGLLSCYSGHPSQAPLDTLGSKRWQQKTQRAKEAIEDVAASLLALNAKREQTPGHQFKMPKEAYTEFSLAFPYVETVDQKRTIQEVIDDMCSTKRMDRLICGDVGFGKTEVAIRAAFIAVSNHKQVAILVPTTLLAEQHWESFITRFHDLPIQIDCFTRLHNTAQQDNTVKGISNGRVDIVIGTHKMLYKKLPFKDLGLLIIDEEHRFGVQAKEKIKALKPSVDLLTMTATPIPRTLDMTISGLKDLSLIASPPNTRRPVKTIIQPYNIDDIISAIERECHRGGQVYYVHNDIKTLHQRQIILSELLSVTVGIAHGQMPIKQMEKTMYLFHQQAIKVLCTTTIIESGINIPNANTIIIERADQFGLAQLHQLRGRVGRAHQQAYAYCLIPDHRLNKEARMRLDAIACHTALGSGFAIATADLEVRGAGMLLGEKQTGHIEHIGYTLYLEWLQDAIRTLDQNNELTSLNNISQVDMQLGIPALIPESHMPDVHQRMVFYQKLSNSCTGDQIDALQIQWIDRFGEMPEPVKRLFEQANLAIKANLMRINSIKSTPAGLVLSFNADTLKVNTEQLILSLKEPNPVVELMGRNQIKLKSKKENNQQLDVLNDFFKQHTL
jgi:transcription-repair coupling factor (superfamily II helicase)